MHLTRAQLSREVPLTRKGPPYIARPKSHHNSAVSVVVAVRDMLKLARTMREVEILVRGKQLKLNGRAVRDVHEPIHLLNILEADKKYKLTLLPTGRFTFEETKDASRVASVVSKTMVSKGKVQIGFHDGTATIANAKDEINTGDSAEFDFKNKATKWMPLKKGANVLIRSGSQQGHEGTVEKVEGKVTVKSKGGVFALNKKQVIVL